MIHVLYPLWNLATPVIGVFGVAAIILVLWNPRHMLFIAMACAFLMLGLRESQRARAILVRVDPKRPLR